MTTGNDNEQLPAAVRALVAKYPLCIRNDFSCCIGQRSETMMEKIVDLVTTHPIYSVDDGEEMLWVDLANVAISAVEEKDDVLDAIDNFLGAAFEEVPTTDTAKH